MGLKDLLGGVGDLFFHRAEEPAAPLFEVAVRCDKGKVREENQDRAAASATPLGALFVVADGVGGLASGALAAQMAVEGHAKFLSSARRDTDPKTALQDATRAVNEAIVHESATTHQSMGSTLALVLLQSGTAWVGHVGDSRVYLVRDGELFRLTRDHSVVQKMVDHGILSDAQSRSHPDASLLTRSLGQKGVELEVSQAGLIDGDALLLCSDGLWGYVEDSALREAVCAPSLSVEHVADALLDLALEAGGGDNISIIFLRLPGGLVGR